VYLMCLYMHRSPFHSSSDKKFIWLGERYFCSAGEVLDFGFSETLGVIIIPSFSLYKPFVGCCSFFLLFITNNLN
jgi:hypothetical protein